jgi:hypothetical protein
MNISKLIDNQIIEFEHIEDYFFRYISIPEYDNIPIGVRKGKQEIINDIKSWHKSSTKALLEAVIEKLNLWLEEKIKDVKKANLETVEGELSRTVAVEAFKRVQDKLKEAGINLEELKSIQE